MVSARCTSAVLSRRWDVGDAVETRAQRLHKHRCRRRGPREAAQLIDRAGDGEVRLDDAVRRILSDARRLLVEHARIGGEAREVRIGLFAVRDRMLAGEEVRNVGVGAGQLRDRVRRLRAGAMLELARGDLS